MRLTLPVLKLPIHFTGSCDWNWSVLYSSDASPRPLNFEEVLLPLTAATVLSGLSGLAPLTEVTATWLGTLSKSIYLPGFWIKSVPSSCLVSALRTCCLLCSICNSFSLAGLSSRPWLSLKILGTIFPIRAGLGVLGMIFPMRDLASGEVSEAWEDFALQSDDDCEVFCGRPLEVPNPVKSSSWR